MYMHSAIAAENSATQTPKVY